MIDVPKTPFDDLPKINEKSFKPWKGKVEEFRMLRHAYFLYEKSRHDQADALYVMTDDPTIEIWDQVYIEKATYTPTGVTGYVIRTNLYHAKFGAFRFTLDEAIKTALEWAANGVVKAVDESRPSSRDVARKLMDRFDDIGFDDD